MLRLAVIICSFFCFDLPSLATAAEYEMEDQGGLSGDFDKIAGSLSNWLIEKNEELEGPFAEAMKASDQKTRVFFGTIVGIFLALVLLFVVKLIVNLMGEATLLTRQKIYQWLGWDTARVKQHSVSPLQSAARDPNDKRQEKSVRKPNKKKFLVGEVLLTFVNPGIDRSHIDAALLRQQSETPRPLIGSLLIENGVAEPEEIEKSLKLQKKYRNSGKPF
ncbi:MAG: hypothetical protein G3M78_14365 [Candidatus Nitrohelix vancouverensis]|uniref:Uncharacterized protein n=1 Tax=Candidatus Nitrohelix vancouverensis TaxID=2705534 RepID=A0A7T0C4V5_9BACT|nr:MAG: hypothetical protein G3M78_14365 [Candidatus Nitrohelix vancouverensis]